MTPIEWFGASDPHLIRGPFTRWPRIADAGLAVLVFVASVASVALSGLNDEQEFSWASLRDLPAGSIVLLFLAAAALLWRRRHPIPTTSVVMVLMLLWALADYGDGQELALIVAVYAVGRYTAHHVQSISVVVLAIAVSVLGTILDVNQRVDVAPALLLTALAWYVGRRVRNRGDYLDLLQERARRLEADQQARARQAVADERARIARELHDVVAHQVSMITVQAGAAKMVARHDLDAAIEAIGGIEHAGRQTLGELRHLLGVLRPDHADTEDLGPQPGLADVPALIDKLTYAGATVSMTLDPPPQDVLAAVNLAAYRIVQESATNIIKHAGPNPEVEISVKFDNGEFENGRVVISVVNSVRNVSGVDEPARTLAASGYGIVGMRERATLLGGTLHVERRAPNLFIVTALIPLESGST